ncbi:MAG TPA: hypothetical protein VNQ73_11960 [Ilumatobacter sp.]|nr:hypothetical protein [Ilumatobacter sp.]
MTAPITSPKPERDIATQPLRRPVAKIVRHRVSSASATVDWGETPGFERVPVERETLAVQLS